MEKLSDNSIKELSKSLSHPTGEGIIIDIGTGDGLFVYQCARQNPRKFYIGIDANPRALEKISEKIRRNRSKGGLPNILYIQAAIEDLPSGLNGIADEVHIHFPWGSLLRSVATGDEIVLRGLRRICSSEALLEIVIGFDPERDRSEMERLELRELSTEYVEKELVSRYRAAGFEIKENGRLSPSEWSNLRTSWAKRLKGNANRTVSYIIAQATTI